MGVHTLEIIDVEKPDLEALDSLVARLKAAPREHVPEDAALRISKWKRPTTKEVQGVLSISGMSSIAKRVTKEILVITSQCEVK